MLQQHARSKSINQRWADWSLDRWIREALSIPVIANGNIREFNDVLQCLQETGADGVMSAEGILANPSLFHGPESQSKFALAYEYLELCKIYPTTKNISRTHIFSIFHDEYVALRCSGASDRYRVCTGSLLTDVHAVYYDDDVLLRRRRRSIRFMVHRDIQRKFTDTHTPDCMIGVVQQLEQRMANPEQHDTSANSSASDETPKEQLDMDAMLVELAMLEAQYEADSRYRPSMAPEALLRLRELRRLTTLDDDEVLSSSNLDMLEF
jgi:hypothetical protein